MCEKKSYKKLKKPFSFLVEVPAYKEEFRCPTCRQKLDGIYRVGMISNWVKLEPGEEDFFGTFHECKNCGEIMEEAVGTTSLSLNKRRKN